MSIPNPLYPLKPKPPQHHLVDKIKTDSSNAHGVHSAVWRVLGSQTTCSPQNSDGLPSNVQQKSLISFLSKPTVSPQLHLNSCTTKSQISAPSSPFSASLTFVASKMEILPEPNFTQNLSNVLLLQVITHLMDSSSTTPPLNNFYPPPTIDWTPPSDLALLFPFHMMVVSSLDSMVQTNLLHPRIALVIPYTSVTRSTKSMHVA